MLTLWVTQVLILWVPGNRTHQHVHGSSALCAIGMLHLPPDYFDFISLGTIAIIFVGIGVNGV